MLIVEGESLADGMLFQAARVRASGIHGVVALAHSRGHLGGGDATFCRACWHCWAVPVPLALFVTVPCSVCPQSPPRSGAGRGAACPAASRRRTPAWSPRPPHPSGSRSVPPLFCRAVGPWGAATGERTLLTPTGECCLLACLEEIEVLLDIGSNRQLSDVSW